MADYFTNFSLILRLPDKAAQDYAVELAAKAAEAHEYGDTPTDFLPALLPLIEDWQFETAPTTDGKKYGVWLSSSRGGVDAACGFVQHLLQKFQMQEPVAFEWSNDCTKTRLDAYGGGAVVITAGRIKTMTTRDWVEKQQRKKGVPR
jgi:hypothetical protein